MCAERRGSSEISCTPTLSGRSPAFDDGASSFLRSALRYNCGGRARCWSRRFSPKGGHARAYSSARYAVLGAVEVQQDPGLPGSLATTSGARIGETSLEESWACWRAPASRACNSICKSIITHGFDAQGSLWHLFADARDGFPVSVPGYKDNRNFACFSKPLGRLYPFPAPIEIYIYQDDIRLGARCSFDRSLGF